MCVCVLQTVCVCVCVSQIVFACMFRNLRVVCVCVSQNLSVCCVCKVGQCISRYVDTRARARVCVHYMCVRARVCALYVCILFQ